MKSRLASIASTACAGAVWLLAAGTAGAQPYHVPVYTGTPLMISIGTVTQQTLNRQIAATPSGAARSSQSTSRSAQAPAAVAEVRSTAVVSAPARMPARMAAHFPQAQRAEVERVYTELLDKYPQLMKQLGVPANDAAAAVAMFVAGSYIAYRGVDFPDEHFKPLYQQMRQIIGAEPAFARATDAERRELYEQMAILGMHMTVTVFALQQQPNPQIAANTKRAAKDYLQQFMKVDADRLRITGQGLVVI
jgi:hypothetical protein